LSDWFAFRRYEKLFVLASEKMGLSPDEYGSIEAHWKGMALLEHGHADLACKSFRQSTILDGSFPAPYLGLARGLAAIEPIDEVAALAAVEKYFDLDPQEPPALAYVIRGSLLGRQGQVDQAITSLKKAIALENDSGVLAGWANSDLADAYQEIGDHTEATKFYQRALELLPGEAAPRNDFSRFLALCSDLRVRDPEKSLQLAREAVELQSDEAEHWTTLGIAFFRNGALNDAEKAARKATELSNGGTAADFLVLAMVNWKSGAQKIAIEFHEKALLDAERQLMTDALLTQLREEANELISKDSTLSK
jgi:Tfp pilus assembly protein PilF